ncbi:MAG: hypothetical protein J6U21_00955 [Bacteroidales bacterium]|nr:hypothetical protein [Bacteroidales bacterium]MBP5681770.1 hypothetical protein [Bacteroidales bacterium]
MNKLLLLIFLMQLSVGVYAQEDGESTKRKRLLSGLIEAELAPSPDYKTRGMSINIVHNVSDIFSVGFGMKPYGMFYPKHDVVKKWFTIADDGSIEQHSSTKRQSIYDDEFCMPLYVVLRCVICKKTNAAPFFEVRIGKDVAYVNDDLYRAFIFGSRFGFKNNYRHAINTAIGLQINQVDEGRNATFLFKVGYEF